MEAIKSRNTAAFTIYAWLLLCTPIAVGQQEAALGISGTYEIVDIRKTNMVMAVPDDPGLEGIALGDKVEFGSPLSWLAGETCTEWMLARATTPTIEIESAMLSDTQVTAARLNENLVDHRVNENLLLSCGVSVRAPVLAVDGRVLITTSPSQQSYLVLEKVAGPAFVDAVQHALKSMKFLDAEPTNIMDEPTRRALGLFAGYLGADYDFNASPVTENLLVAMGLSALASQSLLGQWADEDISAEMDRFRFLDATAMDGKPYLIVSGFHEAESAELALQEIRMFISGLPSIEYSTMADQLKLLKLERVGDWNCAFGLGCYPTGYVVALGPVDTNNIDQICTLFRGNGWFCAAPEPFTTSR